MSFKKRDGFFVLFSLTFLIIALLLNLSACETRERVIKIGNQTILSGEYEAFGLDQKISAGIAVSELSPVEIGGFSYKINLISRDDEGDPEKAFLAAQELVEQDVAAVIGSAFNGTTRVSIPVYGEYNIPILTPSAHGEELSRVGDNFFRMVINNNQRVENIAGFLINQNPQKLVVIDNRSEYALNLVDYLGDVLNDRELEVYKRYSMDFNSEGYDILAENLVLDNPDMIFACMEYDQLAALIDKAREAGVDGRFVTEELGMNDQISVLADSKNLEGLLAVIADAPPVARYTDDKKAVDFWRKYNAYTAKMDMEEDINPGKYAPYTYDAVNIIISSMKKANSILPGDFMDELWGISYDGVVGHIEFDSNGNRIDPPSTVFVFTNGLWARY
ncbi:MAG: branched-chain amino acid ABC transporter substrate-binding protein [Actinomycetota bacterium]